MSCQTVLSAVAIFRRFDFYWLAQILFISCNSCTFAANKFWLSNNRYDILHAFFYIVLVELAQAGFDFRVFHLHVRL